MEIERIDSEISYKDFSIKFLSENRPCLFGRWLTDSWPSRSDFLLPSGREINFEFLRKIYGNCENCNVSNCSADNYGYGSDGTQTQMKFSTFIDQFQLCTTNKLYLKDFHFSRKNPNYKPYGTPIYFQSDWLNEYWESLNEKSGSEKDDFKFIYFGPAGTWTPFHCDVIRSNSWSANIFGVKRWLLIPPGTYLELELVLSEKQEPDMDQLVKKCVEMAIPYFDVKQMPGEVIFVPSNWAHQVRNESDVISLNHNWLNGFNCNFCFNFLENEWSQTKQELLGFGFDRDDSEFQLKVAKIVESSSGIGFETFINLLIFIAETRLLRIKARQNQQETPDKEIENGDLLQPNSNGHDLMDLLAIHDLVVGKASNLIDMNNLNNKMKPIIMEIKTVLFG